MAPRSRAKSAREAREGGAIEGEKEGFSKSFFKVLFGKFSLDMFWGSFRGVKTYSEKKDIWVRTFKVLN